MAINHFAWTFDSKAFHRWLADRTVKNGVLSLSALRDLARETCERPEGDQQSYLNALNIDSEEAVEEFLSPPDDLAYRGPADWYVITMGRFLRSAPHLSGRLLESVVEPLVWGPGVGPAEPIYGRPLSSLVSECSTGQFHSLNEVLASEWGWLRNSDRQHWFRVCSEDASWFDDPPADIIERINWEGHRSAQDALAHLRSEYRALLDMLAYRIEDGSDLRLLLT